MCECDERRLSGVTRHRTRHAIVDTLLYCKLQVVCPDPHPHPDQHHDHDHHHDHGPDPALLTAVTGTRQRPPLAYRESLGACGEVVVGWWGGGGVVR